MWLHEIDVEKRGKKQSKRWWMRNNEDFEESTDRVLNEVKRTRSSLISLRLIRSISRVREENITGCDAAACRIVSRRLVKNADVGLARNCG